MKYILVVVLFITFAYIFYVNNPSENCLSILTWNILADEFIQQSYYTPIPPEILFNRKQRETQIIATLKSAVDRDVILLQEVMQPEYNTLVATFAKTHHILRGESTNWQYQHRHCGNVILLCKTLFTMPPPKMGNFGKIPLDFGLGVRCLYKNRPILIFNIHLYDISAEKRLQQWKELIPYFSANEQIIIGGDFNDHYSAENASELYQNISDAGLKILNHKPSYYIEEKMCIDNILIKGITLNDSEAQVMNNFDADVLKQFITYGSDHLPVYAS